MTISLSVTGLTLEVEIVNPPAPTQNISIPVDDVIMTRTDNAFTISSSNKLQNINFNYLDVISPVEASAADLETAIQEMLSPTGIPSVTTGAGPTDANTTRVTIATDQTPVPVTGNVGSFSKNIDVALTTTAGAYNSGDNVGGVLTLANAVRSSGGTCVLQSLHIRDNTNQKAALTILIFASDPTAGATITDNAAFAYGASAFPKQIDKINVLTTDYETVDGKATATLSGLGRVYTANGSANLYAVIVTTGTPTYGAVSTALAVNFGILQD